mmetsp:Transcript_69877/g.180157  ORF Transcript_69877/g.180157 Transcript_69877/m.180157 type:complete len:268 (-) Transcript_69877:154-957(-)
MPYSSVSIGLLPLSDSSQPGAFTALAMENLPVCRRRSMGTEPFVHGSTSQLRFNARTASAMRPNWSCVTKSALFSSTRSANSIWSIISCTTFRSSSSSTSLCRSRSRSTDWKSSQNRAASMTVTMRSSGASVPSSGPAASPPSPSARALTGKLNVSATSMGSDTPVDSMTRASKQPFFARRATSSRRSFRKVQQMQPLCNSTISAGRCTREWPVILAESMFTSAMSLTTTATFLPSVLLRMWRSSVVLPAPRKPLSTVTGSCFAPSP